MRMLPAWIEDGRPCHRVAANRGGSSRSNRYHPPSFRLKGNQAMSTDISKPTPKREHAEVATAERTKGGPTFAPRIDIWETEDELLLYADMPGVTAENLDIEFENRELRIHGRVTPRHENVNFVYGEYGIGDFFRTFSIGETIDPEKISAELKNGVLTLHLPKTDAVKPRQIKVQSG
jgi:HSP20 family molecular chaperone IbpA